VKKTVDLFMCDHCGSEVEHGYDLHGIGIGLLNTMGTAEGVKCELCDDCVLELIEMVTPFASMETQPFLRERLTNGKL
jgi:hypothetical protein